MKKKKLINEAKIAREVQQAQRQIVQQRGQKQGNSQIEALDKQLNTWTSQFPGQTPQQVYNDLIKAQSDLVKEKATHGITKKDLLDKETSEKEVRKMLTESNLLGFDLNKRLIERNQEIIKQKEKISELQKIIGGEEIIAVVGQPPKGP